MPPKKGMGKLREDERGEVLLLEVMEGEIWILNLRGNAVAASREKKKKQKKKKEEGKEGRRRKRVGGLG